MEIVTYFYGEVCYNSMKYLSGFCQLDHQFDRGHLGENPVELIEQPGRVDGPACPGGPEGAARYPHLVTVGQRGEGLGIAGDAADVQKLCLHGAGAYRRGGEALGPQLLRQAHGERGHIRLGGGVHRHPGIGAERGDGGYVQHTAAGGHKGHRHIRDGGQGPQIQVDHPGLGGGLHLSDVA